MRLLFLGNSHTYYNDMPFLAAELLRAGGDAVEVAMLTRGGQSLAGHLQNEQTRFNLLYGGTGSGGVDSSQSISLLAGLENRACRPI